MTGQSDETGPSERIADLDPRPDSVVVTVRGEIDLATDGELRRTLHEASELADDRPVIVDLTSVSFFASTGASAIAEAYTRARTRGDGLAMVINRDSSVYRALSIMGLVGLIPSFYSLAEALDAASGERQPS